MVIDAPKADILEGLREACIYLKAQWLLKGTFVFFRPINRNRIIFYSRPDVSWYTGVVRHSG